MVDHEGVFRHRGIEWLSERAVDVETGGQVKFSDDDFPLALVLDGGLVGGEVSVRTEVSTEDLGGAA
ncbi:hypothetical protein [Deinococcus wulumuqiensis]|uniref:hypothetical protein n=1 Tax=Deinococcus wulumuqiensis TaxID=980427 RepID=UPI0013C32D5A|nr:hypothetical protein [Deinococcus wulumuqiensis]